MSTRTGPQRYPGASMAYWYEDTYGGDPISDLALTEDGFARIGAAVAALGMPTVVVQEGGYADEALGPNVRAWLTGFAEAVPPARQ